MPWGACRALHHPHANKVLVLVLFTSLESSQSKSIKCMFDRKSMGVVRSHCWFRHNFFYIYCFSFSLNWIQIHPKLTALLEQHDSGGLHDGASCSLPTGDRWSSRPQVTVPRRLSGESHCRQISTLVLPCDPHSLFWCVKRGRIWCFSVYRIFCVRISITYALHMEPGGNLNTVLIIKYLSLIWHSVAQA